MGFTRVYSRRGFEAPRTQTRFTCDVHTHIVTLTYTYTAPPLSIQQHLALKRRAASRESVALRLRTALRTALDTDPSTADSHTRLAAVSAAWAAICAKTGSRLLADAEKANEGSSTAKLLKEAPVPLRTALRTALDTDPNRSLDRRFAHAPGGGLSGVGGHRLTQPNLSEATAAAPSPTGQHGIEAFFPPAKRQKPNSAAGDGTIAVGAGSQPSGKHLGLAAFFRRPKRQRS